MESPRSPPMDPVNHHDAGPSSPPCASQKEGGTESQAGQVPPSANAGQEGLWSSVPRPRGLKHVSTPAHQSPLRHHHHRGSGGARRVKESLNARSEYVTSQDDGSSQHRINQYRIKQEIGRGSFGAVHLATDQYGTEYAIKEFSKSRLRKRAQSHVFRKPRPQTKPGQPVASEDFNSPMFRHHSSGGLAQSSETGQAINLIKEEIAIMKKLNHPNLCALIEVLDDPREDSLYMVMEMCKKGIIMKVGVDERYDPYDNEKCRHYFRDLILGIEFLHAQGVVHRDIKPDNCLLTEDDVVKVADFGVSEMFEKDSAMLTAKSAGSPAFLPPELCVVKHGDVSGKLADIWSMGVTLYCLMYGRLPFEESAIFDLCEAIQTREPSLDGEEDKDLIDLFQRIFEKDPAKRIDMAGLREHPWVTRQASDPLLSEAENVAELLPPPTDAELETAITGNVANLLTVVKAVNKFKRLVAPRSPEAMSSILGEQDPSRFSQPPQSMDRSSDTASLPPKSRSVDQYDRQAVEGALAAGGVHREVNVPSSLTMTPNREATATATSSQNDQHASSKSRHGDDSSLPTPDPPRLSRSVTSPEEEEQEIPDVFRPRHLLDPSRSQSADEAGRRGQAHNPLQDRLYLHIGPSSYAGAGGDTNGTSDLEWHGGHEEVFMVSESPGPADMDIYETAYRDEIERIRQRCKEDGRDEEPNVYLNRRVDQKLVAIGQLAGRFMAKGEDSLGRFGALTGWKERRARVTDVSKALRAATREEYEKRQQEYQRRRQDSAGQGDDAPLSPAAALAKPPVSGEQHQQQQISSKDGEREDEVGQPWAASMFSPTAVASQAMERGYQAKESFRSLMALGRGRDHARKGDSGGS